MIRCKKIGPTLLVAMVAGIIFSHGYDQQVSGYAPASREDDHTSSAITPSFKIRLGLNGVTEIPGLYEYQAHVVTPIQGLAEFNELVFGGRHNSTTDPLDEQVLNNETISLVQFYMATCPDCQGFSNYFKRFANDVGPNWYNLMRIYTVNCNDFANIHLCQEQNPKLIVPNVRWYAMPLLQFNARNNNKLHLNYSSSFLTVAHRQFIDRKRRDLISLRHASLRFMSLMLNELKGQSAQIESASGVSPRNRAIFDKLPTRWHLLERVGKFSGRTSVSNTTDSFMNNLRYRLRRCRTQLEESRGRKFFKRQDRHGNHGGVNIQSIEVKNFLVFEHRQSYIGRTLVTDWSNFSCSHQIAGGPIVLVHTTIDLDLVKEFNINDWPLINDHNKKISSDMIQELAPVLLNFNVSLNDIDNRDWMGNFAKFEMKFLASNHTTTGDRRHLRSKRNNKAEGGYRGARLDRLSQRDSLQKFYTRSLDSAQRKPFRYVSAPIHLLLRRSADGPVRDQSQSATTSAGATATSSADRNALLKYANTTEDENVNWTHESLFNGEESIRYKFNEQIARSLNIQRWPGFAAGHQGEIIVVPRNETGVVSAVDDDQSMMLLTDYYKVLDEIVHVDLLARAENDGYQLMATCCILRDLVRFFPFQGNTLVPKRSFSSWDTNARRDFPSEDYGPESIARHYLRMVQLRLAIELRKQVSEGSGAAYLVPRSGCPDDGQLTPADFSALRLDGIRFASSELERIEKKLQSEQQVGLAPSKLLSWKYCAGSKNYLRGHTCSLWILFHTLTTHEYLNNIQEDWNGSSPLSPPRREDFYEETTGRISNLTRRRNEMDNGGADSLLYKFQVDYSEPPKIACDPQRPDEALIGTSTGQLFVPSTQFVLSNIINLVRFYLPCTNCAAHFSCMVSHSPGLDLERGPRREEDHLLWLWEGHNRVNERTRRTHSEDPRRPKHIFPVYEACPTCYLEKPYANSTFDSMKFNRVELTKFIVARYRRSSILNNKINIEDLFRQQL